MKKTIILLGAFALFIAAPSFGQTQENTKATPTQENANSANLKKQEATPQKQKVKAELKTAKAQKVQSVKVSEKLKARKVQKAKPVERKTEEAVLEEK